MRTGKKCRRGQADRSTPHLVHHSTSALRGVHAPLGCPRGLPLGPFWGVSSRGRLIAHLVQLSSLQLCLAWCPRSPRFSRVSLGDLWAASGVSLGVSKLPPGSLRSVSGLPLGLFWGVLRDRLIAPLVHSSCFASPGVHTLPFSTLMCSQIKTQS